MWFMFPLILALLTGCNTCGNRPLIENKPAANPDPEVRTFSFQESQDLANELSKAAALQTKYQYLKAKYPSKPGSNRDATFVGIQGLKDALSNHAVAGYGDLNQFIAWAKAGDWQQFGPGFHHYDWWMFPIDRPSAGQGMKYTVYQQDIQALKHDSAFLKNYRLGAILLMQSWGWDIKHQKPYKNPNPGQTWRNHDVRLGKLGHSLILFEQWDLYDSLKHYVVHLKQTGHQLENWVTAYFS